MRMRKTNSANSDNILQSNTYKNNIDWSHFDNAPRVQVTQQAKDQ